MYSDSNPDPERWIRSESVLKKLDINVIKTCPLAVNVTGL